MNTNEKLPYLLMFSFWEKEPSADIGAVADKLSRFVGEIGVEGYDEVLTDIHSRVEAQGLVTMYENVLFKFWEKEGWEAANLKMQGNSEFIAKIPRSEKAKDRVRIYRQVKK